MQIFSVVLKLIPMNTAQMSSKCGKEYEKSSENSLKIWKQKKETYPMSTSNVNHKKRSKRRTLKTNR